MVDKHEQRKLRNLFNRACRAFPELSTCAKPLARGAFGFVVDHGDQTLTKLFFKSNSPERLERAQTYFENEIAALQFFESHPLEGIATPVLIGEPQTHEGNQDYIASYRMTRIDGDPIRALSLDTMAPENKRALSKQAGRALARFHEAASQGDASVFQRKAVFDCDRIETVEELPPEANEAIKKADAYLKAHMKAGIVHGDYHDGNIMVDKDMNVSGLIDFSSTGLAPNIFTDFRCIDPDDLPAFIEGYEEESGQVVDRHVVSATILATQVIYLKQVGEDRPEERKQMIDNINRSLVELAPVTGYKPL